MTRKTWQREPWVYFILAESVPLVKIGTAGDVSKRFANLKAESPVPLTLMGQIVGGEQVERWLHYHCVEHRSHNEWFRWNPAVCAIVDRVLRHGDMAAEQMCPKHLRDDLRNAMQRRHLSKSPLPALPYGGHSISWRSLRIDKHLTPLEACACCICTEVE